MNILVTGANGFVGKHLVERLLKEGHQVFALVRNPKNLSDLKHEKLNVLAGDLSPELIGRWVKLLPEQLDSCIHTAGLVHSFVLHDFFEVNAQGTLHLLNALKGKYKSLHFVLISSLAASRPSLDNKTPRDESELNLPISSYGRSKKLAEELLFQNAPKEFTLSVIRPPMVIGPRDTAVLDIFKMVKQRVIVLPGLNSLNKAYSFVCVFDLVETICKTLSAKKNEIYFSAHPEVVTFKDIVTKIRKKLKIRFFIYLPLPLFLTKIAATILSFFYRIFPHKIPLTPDKYYELAAPNFTCSGKKSEEELGMIYNYDLERTIEVTLKDYQERNWL